MEWAGGSTHIRTNTCIKSAVALCELLEEIEMSFDKTSTRNQQQAAKMSSECSTKTNCTKRKARNKKQKREEGGRRGAAAGAEEKPTNLMNSPGILDKCSLTRPKHLAACSIGAGKRQGKDGGGTCYPLFIAI